MRALGIDLGSRRIGVAICDSAGTVASPYETVERSGDHTVDHRRLCALAEEAEVEILVVGLPLGLDGQVGAAATLVLEEVDELRDATSLPVETYDERLTTVTATRLLREAGVKARAQRRMVDQVAAAVILQSWLDGRSRHPRPTGP